MCSRVYMAKSGGLRFLGLVIFLVSAVDGTIDEGVALRTMMEKWKVDFPSWQLGGDPCAGITTWTYVECSNGQVTSLNVSSTGLEGVVPEEVGELTALEVLDISTNEFSDGPANTISNPGTGQILPDSIAKCTQLRSLNISAIQWAMPFPNIVTRLPLLEELALSGTNATGSIPDDFFKLLNLRSVYMGATEGTTGLTGDLQQFSLLQNLEYLSLNRNPFNSPFYEDLGTLTKLVYFNCHTCQLYGGLPESFGRLRNLQNITIHRNDLSGRIPDSWRNLTSLRTLRIDTNYIFDEFPLWMFENYPQLEIVYLSRNRFYGPIPLSIKQMDERFNISNFGVLRWDCNYLTFDVTPCRAGNNCSDKILDQLGTGFGTDSTRPFVFSPNCYGDSTKAEKDNVQQCGKGHELDCDTFERTVTIGGQCPPCPASQTYLNGENHRSCVCTRDGGGSSGGNGISVGAVVGGVLGLLFVFIVILGVVVWWRRKQFSFLDIFNVKKSDEYNEHWEVPAGVQRFTLKDLAKITDDFSDDHVIGVGGFGKVYSGTLDDGRMVAIKRAAIDSLQGVSEFRNEVSLLSRLHARHLVKLEGFCDEEHFQCLVYEYMRNGNLHTHLLRKGTTTPLSWQRRIEIAYAVAQGLEYLHSFADPPVIHRDVKPANILLDENMVAKLADFGISKEYPELNTHVSTRPAGTAGYLDPDYFLRQQLTTASDVYAYGVVLLELVTGQAAIDAERHEDYNLIEWAKKRFRTAGIVSIIDPFIEPDYPRDTFSTISELGLQCASFDRLLRPSMKTVLTALESFVPDLSEGFKSSEKEISHEEQRGAWQRTLSELDPPTEGLLSQSSTDPSAFGPVADMWPR